MIFYGNDFSRKVGFKTSPSESLGDSESLKWNELYPSKLLWHCETCSGFSFKTVVFYHSFNVLKNATFRFKLAGKSWPDSL